jgi:predicted nuclease of predicted toxin-antitoxin system
MNVILDNCLPWRMAKVLQALAPSMKVFHLTDLRMSECNDDEIKRRLASESVIWITRDEEFWSQAPPLWAVVWVDCHNPRLSFLRESLAPAIALHLPNLKPGSRLLATEDLVTVI